MSRENVEIVRRFVALYEAGDRGAWRDYFDPECTWDTSGTAFPMAGVYRGHEGVETFFREWLSTWDDYRFEPREVVDLGEAVMVTFRQGGRGRASGIEVDREFVGLYNVRDGLIFRYQQFESREEALEAVGLSE